MSDNPPLKGPNPQPSPQEKLERKAQQAQDGAKAWAEYKEDEAATRKRTAKLRAQRLAREAKEAAAKKSEE